MEFPFIETWSPLDKFTMFQNLVDSEYSTPRTFPRKEIRFNQKNLGFSIPFKFLKLYQDLCLLTHDKDNQDYRWMNGVGDFYMEDLRLSSSKRNFKEKTPIEYWETERQQILNLAEKRHGKHFLPYELRNAIFSYAKESNPFRPSIALAIYSLFNVTRILDMSSGWGDRLIGALAWARKSGKPVIYKGYDPFADLQERYKAIIQDFKTSGSSFQIEESGFETSSEVEGYYDIAFTSPPYFDFEIYGISKYSDPDEQSIIKYKTQTEWVEGFLIPLMVLASRAVKKNGGIFALNIEGPWMYKVLESSNHFLSKEGMNYRGIVGYASDEAFDRKVHPIFIWERRQKV